MARKSALHTKVKFHGDAHIGIERCQLTLKQWPETRIGVHRKRLASKTPIRPRFFVAPAVSLSFSSAAIATMVNATAANPAEQQLDASDEVRPITAISAPSLAG
jgi:hypothetical protein